MFPGDSEAPRLSLMGPHSFSAAEASRLQPDWYELWLLTLHLCGVNLAMSGVTISLLAWFGLRERVAWASRILWVLILWVGINDAAGLVYYRIAMGSGIPYALIPLTQGASGLITARREARPELPRR